MAIKRKNRLHTNYDEVRVISVVDPDSDKNDLCNLYEQKQREDYDRSKNFLHVMAAFTNRVDEFSHGGELPCENVTIPGWMAEAIASGFRMYETNLLGGARQDLTLDWCFNLTADKKNDFDLFTITAEKVLNDAYELQWLFGIPRELAIEIAHTMIERKYKGEATFRCTADSIIDLAKRKNGLPTLKGWQIQTGHTYAPTVDQRHEYMELLEAYDNLNDEGGVSLSQKIKELNFRTY